MKQRTWKHPVLSMALAASLGLAWSPSSHACSADSEYISSVCIMAMTRGYNFYGFTLANGATLPVAQYQALYSLIGTTYGYNTLNTDFKLPNLQGRVVVGAGTYTDVGGTVNYLPGNTGGATQVTLTSAQAPLAAHSHTLNANAATQPPLAKVNWANGTLAASTTLGTLAGTASGSGLVLNGSSGGNLSNSPSGASLGTSIGAPGRNYSDAAPTVAMKASSITGSATVAFTGAPATTLTGTPTLTIGGATDAIGVTASAPVKIMQPYLAMYYYIATLGMYPTQE